MLTVAIVTPEKALPPLQAEHVTVTAADGELGIRSGHAPLVAALKPGHVMVRVGGKETWWAVAGGVLQVLQDEVKLFVERVAEAANADVGALQASLAKLEGEVVADPQAQRQRDAERAWIQTQLATAKRVVVKPAL